MTFKSIAVVGLAALGAFYAAPSTTAITIGGISFDDNSFADTLISSAGSYTVSGGSSLAQVLTDKDPASYAFSKTAGAYVELGFTDNYLVNGPGPDLAIFELGVGNTFVVSLTIGGTTQDYVSVSTGYNVDALIGGFPATLPLNVALVDLDSFGLPSGTLKDEIVIGVSTLKAFGNTVPSLALVGALNSLSREVPDHGSTAVLGALIIPALMAGVRRARNSR